jgi:hypothetical protein
MSKKNRSLGFKVGARVYIIRPPHNSKRMLDDQNEYNKTGIITREGSSSNGGWFEVRLDGNKDKLVYYRRGSMELVREGVNYPNAPPTPSYPSASTTNPILSNIHSPSMYSINSNSSHATYSNSSSPNNLVSYHLNSMEPLSLEPNLSRSTPRKRTDRDRERDRERHRRKKAAKYAAIEEIHHSASGSDGESVSYDSLSSLPELDEDEQHMDNNTLHIKKSSKQLVNSVYSSTPLSVVGFSPLIRPSLRVLLATEQKDDVERDFDELISVYSNDFNSVSYSKVIDYQDQKKSARKSTPHRSLSGAIFEEKFAEDAIPHNNPYHSTIMLDSGDESEENDNYICASCRCESSSLWRECSLLYNNNHSISCMLCDSCSLSYIRFKSNCWRCLYVYSPAQQSSIRCPQCRAIHPDLINQEAAVKFAEEEANNPLII